MASRCRRLVAIFGFMLAAAAIVPATITSDPHACVGYTCFAVFGLEVTVGVSWAIPLDIGADFDMGKIAGLGNSAIHLTFSDRHGQNLAATNIGKQLH